MNKEELLQVPQNDFISSYPVAYNFVQNASESYGEFWRVIKACQNHIAGEKPIPPDKLKERGLAWTYNFNYGKARAKMEKGVAESTSKISSALSMGYVSFRNFKESDREDEFLLFLEDNHTRGVVAANVGACLAATLAKENRLSGWLNEVEYPSYAFGYCATIFDRYDWMPEPTHPLNIAFKPNTKPESIPAWVTFKNVEANEIYKRWINARNEQTLNTTQDGKQAIKSSGWNLKGLEAVLFKSFRGKIKKDGMEVIPDQWEDIIPTFRQNPSYVIMSTDVIKIAKIFYKEIDGSLSEVYIPWSNAWQSTSNREEIHVTLGENDVDYILYKKNHGQFKQSDFICIVRDSGFSETGFLQDYRGAAKYAVEDSVRYNRTRNSAGNKLTFVGSPMFESDGSQATEKFKITVSQGFTILPPNHRLVEKQPSFNIADHINILRFEEGEYLRDTQQYDPTLQGRLTSRPNKDEVQQVSQEVKLASSSKNNIKLRDYAEVFFTVIKKIGSVECKESDVGYEGKKRFFELLKGSIDFVNTDSDVKKLLGLIESFVLEPVISDIESITIGIQMAETPFARNRLRRMMLIAKGFPIEEVNIAVPLITDKFHNMQDRRMAMIENDMFFTTNEVLVTGTDDHIVHLETHFEKIDKLMKGFQDGALDALVVYKYLENIMGHTLTHIEMLGEDPVLNGKAQEFMAQFKMRERQKKDIMIVAQNEFKRQQEEAAQLQMDPEKQANIALKNTEAQSNMQRKDWVASERTKQRETQMQQTHEQKMKELDLAHERKILELQQNL